MRLETCIRKGLRLKAHRVFAVREEAGRLVAEIEWIEGSALGDVTHLADEPEI